MFTVFDSLILVIYFLAVLVIGLYHSRKADENFVDYFLTGRSMGWVAIGISIFATNISSEHFIGLAGEGSSRGLAVGQFELMAIAVLIFLGWVVAPIYVKTGVNTIPEFLELRFDRSLRKIYAGISICIYLFTKILVSLFAGGLLFTKIFGLNIYASAIIIVLFTGLYSVTGGSKAIMRTQVFQGMLLIVGAVLLTVFGLNSVGGYSGLKQKLPSEFFNIFKAMSDPDYPWTGILFGAPIIAIWYWCTDQYIVQRILSARSVNDSRRGALLAAFLKVFPLFILVLPGLIAKVLYPDIAGDEAYSALIAGDLLPVGIKGLVVAGLLAAVMSSLAGAFNTTAAIFTNDYYKLKYPDASQEKLVLIGRLVTIAVVIIAILIVPMVRLISSQVYLFLQSIQAFISPPITAVFLFAFFSKKITSRTALIALITGEAIGMFRLLLEVLKNMGVALPGVLKTVASGSFLHFAIIIFIISSSIIIVRNIVTVPAENKFYDQIRSILSEIKKEVSAGYAGINSAREMFYNLIISIFIVLIIISLWSIWL